MGLSRSEALALPLGQLLDLIAVHQIKVEGAQQKKTQAEEENEFWAMMHWR